MQSCSGRKSSDVRVGDSSALHPWPVTSRHHRPWRMNSTVLACVLIACQTQCQGRLPQQTFKCHSNFSTRALKGSQDTRYSRPIELNLTCIARSTSSINALRPCNVTCHLAWTKMWHPRPRGKKGGRCGGGLSVVAALLYSWLHSACASNYRQKRGGPVQHVVPFRAGETM